MQLGVVKYGMTDGGGVVRLRPVHRQHIHKTVCGEGVHESTVPRHNCAADGRRGRSQGWSQL
jgi:hypothetical protein